jgi:hypothetical protein
MSTQRFSATVLLAAALLVSGCNKKDKAAEKTPEPAGSAAAPATPPPAPTPAAPAPAAADSTSVVPLAKLAAIMLPPPKGAPATGVWATAPSPTGGSGDGDRLANFTEGSDYWVSVRFLDCNLPVVKESASKPSAERGAFTFCFDPAPAKLKDYPLFNTSETQRVVKVGHLIIIATLGATGETKLKPEDLEAFLESLDLAEIAKL